MSVYVYIYIHTIYIYILIDAPSRLLQLVGAVILGVGIWVLTDARALNLVHVATVDSTDSLVRGAAVTFVAIGVVVFVTGFLGCCGAVRESAGMLLLVRCPLVCLWRHFKDASVGYHRALVESPAMLCWWWSLGSRS